MNIKKIFSSSKNQHLLFISRYFIIQMLLVCSVSTSYAEKANSFEPVGYYCFDIDIGPGSHPLILSAFAADEKYFPIFGEFLSNPIYGSAIKDTDNNTIKITFTTSEVLDPLRLQYGTYDIYYSIYSLLLYLDNENWEGKYQFYEASGPTIGTTIGTIVDDDHFPYISHGSGTVKKILCN